MTEVGGWDAGVERGRERAEAALAGIPEAAEPDVPVADGPRPWTPEWHARELAAELLAGEAAAEKARRRSRRQDQVGTQVTSAPGMPPDAAERRAWALKAISDGATTVIASPGTGPPKVSVMYRMPDGQVRLAKSAQPATIQITPENADVVDAWFGRQQRDDEDTRLIAHYGAEQCVAEGIVAAADAERLEAAKPLPGPGHYPGDITRTVA